VYKNIFIYTNSYMNKIHICKNPIIFTNIILNKTKITNKEIGHFHSVSHSYLSFQEGVIQPFVE